MRNEDRKARVRIDSIVPTSPSWAEAERRAVARALRGEDGVDVRDLAVGRLLDLLAQRPRDRDLLAERQLGLEEGAGAGQRRVVGLGLEVVAEHRRDQQQAEHQTRVASRDRPAPGTHQAGRLREAGRAEDRERQPHARAAQGERDRGQRTADPREEGQPGQAARQHDRTRGAADRGAHAGGEGADRERRRGERAHDDRAGDGVVAPDDDEQQHAEEQRAHERAEGQHLADVGEERTPLEPAGPIDGASAHAGCGDRDHRGDRDGHLDEEDGPPGEDLGEEPAQGRSDRGAERRGRHPPGAAPAHGAGQVDEHGQGRHEGQRGAEALEPAAGVEHADGAGHAAERRAGGEAPRGRPAPRSPAAGVPPAGRSAARRR